MRTNWKKRLLFNVISLLVVVGIAYLAYQKYEGEENIPDTEQVEGLPALKTLVVIDSDIDDVSTSKGKLIKIALLFSPTETSEQAVVDDLLAIYTWSLANSFPYKCGDEYPKELCRIDLTVIYLVIADEESSLAVEGDAHLYSTQYIFGLDQQYIELMLTVPPATIKAFTAYHQRVSTETKGTGGFVADGNNESFLGFDSPHAP